MLKNKKICIIGIVLLLLLAVGCGSSQLPAGTKVIVKVKDGMAAGEIAKLLEEKKLISNSSYFRTQLKLRGLDNALQAGEYEFTAGMSDKEIMDKMAVGDVRYVSFTIPEGFNVKQIAELMEQKQLASKKEFLDLAKNYTPYDYMKTDDPLVEYKCEGFLFPSTYKVSPGARADAVLALLAKEFDKQLTLEMRKAIVDKKLSIRDFVTLASLVEKEAAVEKDRPLIARAFLTRLDIAMPLQSCATIQYILGYAKPELTIADTQLPSPYNTYLHYGLPPGPIANPGLLSMQAVINPAAESYLYFVVQKDGSHIFSKTYQEHLAAIQRASQ